jgi:hypothetical protein
VLTNIYAFIHLIFLPSAKRGIIKNESFKVYIFLAAGNDKKIKLFKWRVILVQKTNAGLGSSVWKLNPPSWSSNGYC